MLFFSFSLAAAEAFDAALVDVANEADLVLADFVVDDVLLVVAAAGD